MPPIRIQRSRQRKQVSPNGLPIKYVGRPTKWGNPYKIIRGHGYWRVEGGFFFYKASMYANETFDTKREAIDYSIDNYKHYVYVMMQLKKADPSELRGYNLSCWCSLDHPCHVDYLLTIANQ